jgi:hypothetical protein
LKSQKVTNGGLSLVDREASPDLTLDAGGFETLRM